MPLQYDDFTHTYTVDGTVVPSVTQILKEFGFYKGEQYFTTSSSGRGKYIHEACQMYDEGVLDLDSAALEHKGYIQGWVNFLQETKLHVIDIERPIYHELYRFAGTVDRFGILYGKKVILDIKTGVPQPSDRLQTAGYQWLYNGLCELIDGRYCLYLKQNGTYKLKEHKEREDCNDFLALVRLWYRKNNKEY
ncbi:MAG: hypothetical protein L3V56_03625 [Candidatus Magnetoovum sp. WYHC-5]|nr:hypothetical protein [Candidatus Magnetoovum sp. WYHC-5]